MDRQVAIEQFASVPENEYTMLALARAVGIEVPRTELIDVSEIHGLPADAGTMEGKALAVQRFDRGTAGEAIHMEDFTQVFGLYPQDKYHHRSYANIAAVLWPRPEKPAPTNSSADWSSRCLLATATCT